MTYAAITGWGKCMPPSVLSNADLATFLETDDEWIISRTGMHERRISHVSGIDMAHVASRARARLRGARRAGRRPHRLRQLLERRAGAELGLGRAVEARRRACGGDGRQHRLHELPLRAVHRDRDDPHRRGQQRRGHRRRADLAVHGLGQSRRRRAVRRRLRRGRAAGDASARKGCSPRNSAATPTRATILRVRGMGMHLRQSRRQLGDTLWDFDGQEIFKRAVHGMTSASQDVLAKTGHAAGEIDLVVPHQANLRIIEAVAKRIGVPMERVFLTVQRYGNMSAATVPVALVEALEEGRVKPGALILTPGVRRRPHVVLASHPLGRADDAAHDDRPRPAAADADGAGTGARPDCAEAAARALHAKG